ncbi:MAG: hypothetical protein JEY79_19535 [Pseudodesulfovibrio sp.]|nr:hypothetical protein [Pseudodesulfovibrio sp.]
MDKQERIKKNIEYMQSLGSPREDIDEYLSKKEGLDPEVARFALGMTQGMKIDMSSGIEWPGRMLQGKGKQSDQFATLSQYYSKVIPYGEGNFMVKDGDTWKLANPKGFDSGDVAQNIDVVAEGIGGVLGAAAGATAANPATAYLGTGLGAGIGKTAMDAILANVGRVDTRGVPELAKDAAMTVGLNTVAPGVIDKGLDLGKAALKGMAAPIANRTAGAGPRQLYQDFSEAGIRPDIGAISGNRGVQTVESFVTKLPTSARIMQKAQGETLAGTAEFAKKVASELGPLRSAEDVGETVLRAMPKAVDRYKKTANNMFRGVEKIVGRDTPVPISSTAKAYEDIVLSLGKTPGSNAPEIEAMVSSYNNLIGDAKLYGGAIPFESLRSLRGKIGSQLSDPFVSTISGIDKARMKQIYGAMTEDMRQAAYAKAGGKGLEIFDKSNLVYSHIMNVEIPLLETVQKSGMPEKAYNMLFQQSAKGGSRLRQLKRNMTPDEWDIVAGSTMAKMGMAKPGAQNVAGDAFSVDTFLTNWNRIAPEAKEALFGGTKYAKVKPEIDRLLRVVGALKDSGIVKNTSNTATYNALWSTLVTPVTIASTAMGATSGGFVSGMVSGGATAGGLILAPMATAKLITNPRFVRWLTQGSRVAANTKGSQQAQAQMFSKHLARLVAVAEAEPEIEQEVMQYYTGVSLKLKEQERNQNQ